MAQLERDIIAERVKAGLRRAKENGKRIGRPAKKVDGLKVSRLRNEGQSWRQIAKGLKVSKSTVARWLA